MKQETVLILGITLGVVLIGGAWYGCYRSPRAFAESVADGDMEGAEIRAKAAFMLWTFLMGRGGTSNGPVGGL